MRNDFDRDGVVLLRDIIRADVIDAVREEYESITALSDIIPKHEPIVVYWTHVPGMRKKIVRMRDMPIMGLFCHFCADIARPFGEGDLRLLETIIFNKPPHTGTKLNWHQDVSYFPFEPNNQIALWIPFDPVTKENGAMHYALGTHQFGLRASTDLHSGKVFTGEERDEIPDDPAAVGYEVRCMEMQPGDVLVHHGRTWHYSGPNTTAIPRRGLSLRFLVGDTYYKPRAGSAAAFIKQIDIQPGDRINDPAFPVL